VIASEGIWMNVRRTGCSTRRYSIVRYVMRSFEVSVVSTSTRHRSTRGKRPGADAGTPWPSLRK
jgi:hypothetical protein